jgi:hypothetical protein
MEREISVSFHTLMASTSAGPMMYESSAFCAGGCGMAGGFTVAGAGAFADGGVDGAALLCA